MDRTQPDFRMSATGLYRDETFTDRRVGTLHRLVPVTADGADDPGRPVIYEGQTSVFTPAGSLPLIFEIEASTLADALEKFAATAQQALEQTLRELEEIRRAAASSLVVPGVATPPGLGGPGGLPGGGRIRMP
jgi:hypothetical protein